VGKLGAAIMRFGRLRQHLDDHARIEERVAILRVKAQIVTGNGHVGVGEQPRGLDVNALVAREDEVAAVLEQGAQRSHDVAGDGIVLPRSAGHRDDHSMKKLVLGFAPQFVLEVLVLDDQDLLRSLRHAPYRNRSRGRREQARRPAPAPLSPHPFGRDPIPLRFLVTRALRPPLAGRQRDPPPPRRLFP